MSSKKQAKELIDSFHQLDPDTDSYNGITFQLAKECALLCVNRIIAANPHLWIQRTVNYVGVSRTYDEEVLNKEYWREVKKEIENYEQ